MIEKKDYHFIIDPSLCSSPEEQEANVLIPIKGEFDADVSLAKTLPILPLQHTVLFPDVLLSINVGRTRSKKTIEEIFANKQHVAVFTQSDSTIFRPVEDNLYTTGTIARIARILEMPDESIIVVLHGKKRIVMESVATKQSLYQATYQLFEEAPTHEKDAEFEALTSSIKDLAERIIDLSHAVSREMIFVIKNITDPGMIVNFISTHIPFKVYEKQKILEIADPKQQATSLLEVLAYELQLLELKYHIENKIKADFDQQQREYMLRQQIRTMQEELGIDPLNKEIKYLEETAIKKRWGMEQRIAFDREMQKLQRLHPSSVEYSNQLNYLYTLLELPWNEYTKNRFDLKHAQKVLDKEHFGLDKVNERLLEYLAVLKLKNNLKSPILCLVGPPGVGKTSLGKSIAKALKRNYVRMSLGGLHDESEIRGHRKTYIGAMPGRIIQNIRKAKSANPVFVLDEIDKIGAGIHGDPASALLEVLDPEQNNAFYDNYLELEFDLSKVLFVATANNLTSISPALRDRMEVIEVNGYVLEEKIAIAQKHLIPKQINENGLNKRRLVFTPKAIAYIIENYTRESGVRELDKAIASIIRNLAKKVVLNSSYPKTLHVEHIREILGAPKYLYERYQNNDYIGVVTGLAWTAEGGDILFIESSLSRGSGALTLTGNLGQVMKESAVIALEYLKANCQHLQIPHEVFDRWNVHVHVPEGAIPKDGPSAGLAMVIAMASIFTRRKIRDKIAVTGEITLRGKILPVGGIKEKILAAKRANITNIYLPAANRNDIEEVNELFISGLNFIYVDDVSDVLRQTLLDEKVDNIFSTDSTNTFH